VCPVPVLEGTAPGRTVKRTFYFGQVPEKLRSCSVLQTRADDVLRARISEMRSTVSGTGTYLWFL
jgi:hypothetical protein